MKNAGATGRRLMLPPFGVFLSKARREARPAA